MEQINNVESEMITRLQKVDKEDYDTLFRILQKMQEIDVEQFANLLERHVNKFFKLNVRGFKNLFESEPIFADFFYSYKKINKLEDIANKLIDLNILYKNIDEKFQLTNLGNALFSIHSNDRKIIVKKKSVNNKLYYINETFFDVPLYKTIDKLSNYIYISIPNFQIRSSSINSHITKFIDLDSLKRVLKYIIAHSEVTTPEMLKIEINRKYLKFDFLESDRYLDLFQQIWDTIDTYDSLLANFSKKDIEATNEKTGNYRSIIIQLYPRKLEFERDWIDDEIIEMAYNNEKFSRKSIDERFEISSRNSNYRLARLISLGILSKEGIGKATTYFLNQGLNQFDEI